METRTTPLSLYNSVISAPGTQLAGAGPLLPRQSKQVLQLLRDNLFINGHRVNDPTHEKCNHTHTCTRISIWDGTVTPE